MNWYKQKKVDMKEPVEIKIEILEEMKGSVVQHVCYQGKQKKGEKKRKKNRK